MVVWFAWFVGSLSIGGGGGVVCARNGISIFCMIVDVVKRAEERTSLFSAILLEKKKEIYGCFVFLFVTSSLKRENFDWWW